MILDKQIKGVVGELPLNAGLLVVGDDVTSEQANEILVRTLDIRSGDIDMAWQVKVRDAYREVGRAASKNIGLAIQAALVNQENTMTDGERLLEVACDHLGVLPLELMHNHRIQSPFIEGARGWCDWGGFIGANSYNVPVGTSIISVWQDWRKIASAFPFLNVRCQVLDNHINAARKRALIEFVISNGTVRIVEPEGLLTEGTRPTLKACADSITEGQLKLALDAVAAYT